MVKERRHDASGAPRCRGYRGCRGGSRVQAEKAASRATKSGDAASGATKSCDAASGATRSGSAASSAAGCSKAASGARPAAQRRLGMAEKYAECAQISLKVAQRVNTKQAWAEADAAISLAERELLDFHVRQIKPKKVLEETCEPTLARQPAAPCEVAMQPAAPCEVAMQPAAPCEVAMQPAAPCEVAMQPAAPRDCRGYRGCRGGRRVQAEKRLGSQQRVLPVIVKAKPKRAAHGVGLFVRHSRIWWINTRMN